MISLFNTPLSRDMTRPQNAGAPGRARLRVGVKRGEGKTETTEAKVSNGAERNNNNRRRNNDNNRSKYGNLCTMLATRHADARHALCVSLPKGVPQSGSLPSSAILHREPTHAISSGMHTLDALRDVCDDPWFLLPADAESSLALSRTGLEPPPELRNLLPTSWLGHSARPGVAHLPAGEVVVLAAGAPPITRLDFDGSAMGIVADVAPLEVVVPALRAEPIAWSPALK